MSNPLYIYIYIYIKSNPCWYAFNGDTTSSWRTLNAGHMPSSSTEGGDKGVPYGATSYFSTEQWIEIDFGALTPERWVLPTAMAILCDVEEMGDDDQHNHTGYNVNHAYIFIEIEILKHAYSLIYIIILLLPFFAMFNIYVRQCSFQAFSFSYS